MPQKIEISTRTILFIFALITGLWFLLIIRDILFLLFVAFIITSALTPVVDYLESFKLPRALAILLIYSVLILLLVLGGSLIFPPLLTESAKLINNIPVYATQLSPYIKINLDTVFQQIAPLGQNVLMITLDIFSHIVSILTILVFSFYFLLARNSLDQFIGIFIGTTVSKKVMHLIYKVELRLGAWVRGQIILCLVIAVTSFIGLSLLGINYALPLALIAGILEAIPIIGPSISAIPALLVALTASPSQAIAVGILYFLIQQFENHIVVPTVMKKTVGIPPLGSLISLMIGGKLGGILGVLLAIPTFLVIQTIGLEWMRRENV